MIRQIKKRVKVIKISFNRGENLILLLLIAFILRMLLYTKGTLLLDFNTFVAWSDRLVNFELTRFYESWSDYLPGYLYILWFLGKIKNVLVIDPLLLYKLPAIIADLLTGGLIYLIVSRLKSKKWGLLAAGFYVFNPAIWANSTLWGQVDSLTAFFALLAVYALPKNWLLSALSLSFGTAIKPQVSLAAIVILVVMLRQKWRLPQVIKYLGFGALIFGLFFVPFAKHDLVGFIFQRVLSTLNQYPYTSINAFNFWGFLGFWQEDVFGFWGIAVFVGITFFAALAIWKKKISRYQFLAIIVTANFLFFTRMHERHLLPALAPLVITSTINPLFWLVYVGFSITYSANLFYSFFWINNNFVVPFSQTIVTLFIFVNMILFVVLFIKSVRLPRMTKSSSWLFLILTLSLIARLFFLSYPSSEYFDEVYHAFTARRMLHADPKAWEWWNTPPKGFAYEWTHPPLAKLGMVWAMIFLGENAFAWRVPGVILGTGAILLVYLLARKLFKSEKIALLSATIFSLDGLSLVMSRIGMNDIYFLFFMLLALYLFLGQKNFASAFFWGLALASKWSVIWSIPIFVLFFFIRKHKTRLSLLWFVILPPLVYLTSYLPMFLTGHSFEQFIEVQKQMWWYHTRLEATHPFTSPWWSWPLLLRPIWLHTSGVLKNTVANIYAMGNPVVFWFGLLAVGISFIWSFIKKNKSLVLVVFAYFCFFVPWAASPRIMFLYHYLPSIPFLALASGFVLKRYSKLTLPVIVLSLLVFIYFYPHWTGLKVPLWLDNSYYWLKSWK